MVPTRGKTTFVFNQKGNRFHYLVITCNGKESEKEYMYMYITESLCCTPESNIHCKSTTLQLKERKEGRKEEGRKEGRKERNRWRNRNAHHCCWVQKTYPGPLSFLHRNPRIQNRTHERAHKSLKENTVQLCRHSYG